MFPTAQVSVCDEISTCGLLLHVDVLTRLRSHLTYNIGLMYNLEIGDKCQNIRRQHILRARLVCGPQVQFSTAVIGCIWKTCIYQFAIVKNDMGSPSCKFP
ncbi:hypothetical protein N7489_000504 [Penicillium chrysogenum]|uniref:Uncharacterized protein n=1 Tax=Penicillium chrysogenum TaxID=5076 RepID=A0ABQ8WG07_PENCH|nr:uncharacterized protein N7489_000504 [Penicillium chrysogenum]KAJ5250094.1 hypothetical protein N7489_000504 [Penicillium chrysogenum]KAJ5269000.1 hypothetical protein N7505_004758 [Penicillium chrysogenum]KAJ6148287.1 hypothetical protein N7497_010269 [Penicillium chrysogenum]